MKTFTIIDKYTLERVTMTVPEIIEEINRDRSDEWSAYDESDWIEGLLIFTDYKLELKTGDVLYWNDPDDGICSGPVTVTEGIVLERNDVVFTNRGDMPSRELGTEVIA